VLVAYGSESGTAKRGITKIAEKWKTAGIDVVDIVEGNAAPELKSLKDKCDVLVISTSSFGEGDPPANFNMFLLGLLRGAKAGDMPLAGMQHVRQPHSRTPRISLLAAWRLHGRLTPLRHGGTNAAAAPTGGPRLRCLSVRDLPGAPLTARQFRTHARRSPVTTEQPHAARRTRRGSQTSCSASAARDAWRCASSSTRVAT
jgi:hypothetical protein